MNIQHTFICVQHIIWKYNQIREFVYINSTRGGLSLYSQITMPSPLKLPETHNILVSKLKSKYSSKKKKVEVKIW